MKIIDKTKSQLEENRKAWVDMFYIFRKEMYNIFTDGGAIVIFFIATVVYPLVVGLIYHEEILRDSPIAVVDQDHSSLSRKYIRMLDATPEVCVVYQPMDMAEARRLQEKGYAHGIVLIPKGFSKDINQGKQTCVSTYADVTSFFWYRNLSLANSMVARTMGYEIEAKGLIAKGDTYDDAIRNTRKFIPQERVLFNPGGYPSSLLPIILVLILQQTILMGTGIMAGKYTERSRRRNHIPANIHYSGLYRIIFGRALAIFSIYIPISVYALIVVPKLFNLPQLASNPWEVLWFILPYILASIFLGMALATFFRHRENAIVAYIAISIPLLLMTGFPWPREAMPKFWLWFSYLFPSTFAAQGYVRMNTLGASLLEVNVEHFCLWMQTGVYFLATFLCYRRRVKRN